MDIITCSNIEKFDHILQPKAKGGQWDVVL